MKLKINKYITLAFVAVLSASCSDSFLEEKKNYGSVDDSFYESQERANWYVNNVYFDYYSAFKSPNQSLVGSFTDVYSKMTEEVGGIQPLINPTITYVNAADGSGYYGGKLEDKINNVPYNRIRDCNSFIRDIDVKGANLDKTFRDQAKGQLYYLRAVQYFDLMKVYGGVPIVTEVQTPSSENEEIKVPRATVTQVVEQIVKDLDMEASLLPPNWTSEYGRVTKGAALAVKSRVLLTYASPLFNKNWDNSNERWEAALKAGLEAETALTAAGYGLYGNSAKDWQNMFALGGNAFCSEAITTQLLTVTNSNVAMNNSWEKAIRPISQGGTGSLEAPKEMIDLFPMDNGARPTTANGYNSFLFFMKRDPRFYRTFAFSGVKWDYKDEKQAAKPTVWAYRWLDGANKSYYSDSNNETSPALVRKMTDLTATNASSFQYSGNDILEYRYAELLLNIAECYAALGQTGNATAYLGRIRKRVGINAANNYGIGTLSDKYAAIEAVLYERRVELAYEGKRFWDIQRWMLYDNATVSGTTSGSTITKLGLQPINGTQRTGNYLQYKNPATNADPLAAARASISADPDSANFQTQLTALATFYTDNFIFAAPPTPMDNVNNAAVKIKFNPNYYIMGLQNTVLSQNPWLKQTIGWKDASGGDGDYNYQQ